MFLGYIHYFRALAILFIVSGHSIDVFGWGEESNIENWLRIFISNGTVLFVFIAGYLFQHLSGRYAVKKYYGSKIKNVLIPYIIVSIPAIFIFVTVMERDTVWGSFYDNPVWLQVSLFYLTGKHLAPLWFIPMISIIYLISPFLVRLDRGEVFYYALPLFLLLTCFFGRGLPHESFVHFFSVYLLGMYCSRYKVKVNELLVKPVSLLFLLIMVLAMAYFEFFYMSGTMTFVNTLQKIFMSLMFLGIFIKAGDRLESKFIHLVADTSFGVFFIHSYVLTGFKMSYEHFSGSLMAGDVFSYAVLSVMMLLVSMSLILFVKHLSGRYSRFLVGS